MHKKILDIIPPSSNPSLVSSKEPPLPLEKSVMAPPKINEKKRGGISRATWSGLVVTILATAGIFCYFTFSNADIEIWPETDVVKFEKEITVDIKAAKNDPEAWFRQRVIPGEFLVQKKEISQQFSSTGVVKKDEKARGRIRVHNNYQSPVTLIAGTRFMSDAGKQFHLLSKVSVPAKGYIDVDVEADEAGEDYNIKPSKFSVPGLRNYSTELFYNTFGESSAAMEGGSTSNAPQVTQDDIEKAESLLTKKILADGANALKSAIPLGFILLNESLDQKVIAKSSSVKAGQDVDSFTSKAEIDSKALIFKRTDLDDFAKKFINSQINQHEKIHENSLDLSYTVKKTDLESGIIVLSLKFSAKIYPDIDFQELKKEISGKTLAEAKMMLEGRPEFIKASVNLSPFWVRRVSESLEKIEMRFNLD